MTKVFKYDWKLKEVFSKISVNSYDLLINPLIVNDIIKFHLFCYNYLKYRKISYNFHCGFSQNT